MTAISKIVLRSRNQRREEAIAAAAFKPGHLIELDSTLKVQKHSVYGGFAERLFAIENSMHGDPLTTAFAIGDNVGHVVADPGDQIGVRVPAGALAITKGNFLISDGAGCLIKSPFGTGGNKLYTAAAASTAVSNGVSTEQDFDLTYAIPAGFLRVGDIVKVTGYAVVSAAAGTDTLTVKVYLGATAILTSAAVNATTADVVVFEAFGVVRTIGASGTYIAFGEIGNGVLAAGTMNVSGVNSTAINTTIANTIKASATWSATTATCTVALQSLIVEVARSNPTIPLARSMETLDNSAGTDEAFLRVRVL